MSAAVCLRQHQLICSAALSRLSLPAQNLEAVLFDSPTSRAKTLQSYYYECSQGLSNMNSSNSRVGAGQHSHRPISGPISIL
jgi:hypothetical protein